MTAVVDHTIAPDQPWDGAADAAWTRLVAAVHGVQALQATDGSIVGDHADAAMLVGAVIVEIGLLAPCLPHDAAYLVAVRTDLQRWRDAGFGVPDFLDSLQEFAPQQHRVDGLEHVVVFPMYTQNGSTSRHLEAVRLRTVWPEWIAALEATSYENRAFVPVAFIDFTSGYDTNSAVLFPESVAVRETPVFTWGAIFCDREAARFRAVIRAVAETTGLALPDEALRLLDDQHLAEETFVMWDLIHDRAHSRGDLPFDPFMIKQRMPFWLYSLEELRCDLTAFRAAVELEAAGNSHARLTQHAILLDRMLRFPIVGSRVRNYDGLGGQLLFAFLHQRRVVDWTDNRLRDRLGRRRAGRAASCSTRSRSSTGVRSTVPKVAHWIAAYELVTTYVTPNPASTWAKGVDALPLDGPPKGLTDAVLAGRVPAQHVLRGADQASRRRRRGHPRHHRLMAPCRP